MLFHDVVVTGIQGESDYLTVNPVQDIKHNSTIPLVGSSHSAYLNSSTSLGLHGHFIAEVHAIMVEGGRPGHQSPSEF